MIKTHLEKTISKNRTKISLYYRFYLEFTANSNRHLVVMEDIITDEVLVAEDFEDRKEAIEYMSNLYNNI